MTPDEFKNRATERDEVVAGILGELLDDGLVYFYEAADFGSSYTREVPESAGLPREDVTAALSQGSRPGLPPGGDIRHGWVIGLDEWADRPRPEGHLPLAPQRSARADHDDIRPVHLAPFAPAPTSLI